MVLLLVFLYCLIVGVNRWEGEALPRYLCLLSVTQYSRFGSLGILKRYSCYTTTRTCSVRPFPHSQQQSSPRIPLNPFLIPFHSGMSGTHMGHSGEQGLLLFDAVGELLSLQKYYL